MKKRKCEMCGKYISHRPDHHYLCYECWIEKRLSQNFVSYDESDYKPQKVAYNQTYEERYKGDSEYDMGPNWDYDEYPPENL